jgi:hypothetical protein
MGSSLCPWRVTRWLKLASGRCARRSGALGSGVGFEDELDADDLGRHIWQCQTNRPMRQQGAAKRRKDATCGPIRHRCGRRRLQATATVRLAQLGGRLRMGSLLGLEGAAAGARRLHLMAGTAPGRGAHSRARTDGSTHRQSAHGKDHSQDQPESKPPAFDPKRCHRCSIPCSSQTLHQDNRSIPPGGILVNPHGPLVFDLVSMRVSGMVFGRPCPGGLLLPSRARLGLFPGGAMVRV